MSDAAVIGWTLGDHGTWECDLPGLALCVSAPDDDPKDAQRTNDDDDECGPDEADLILLPWVWRVFRTMDRFTRVELDSGRADTRDRAMIEAEGAAGTRR